MKVISKDQCPGHYIWGNDCIGWDFVDGPSLSVKLENMPPHTSEIRHFHHQAQQFFFVLQGEAKFEIENDSVIVQANHGILISPYQKHRILNHTNEALEFILISQPSTANDRINCG